MEHGSSMGSGARQNDAATRTASSWRELGYLRPVDYDSANLFRRICATWASPFLERGKKEGFKQDDADPLLAYSDRLEPLVENYQKGYACEEEAAQSKSSAKETRNLFLYTLLRCNIRLMIVQSALAACVSLCRVLTAVGFRQYVRWLLTQEGDETEGGPPSGWWYGWMWAGLLIVFQIGSVVGQNQQFWCGSRLGHRWTQQAVAAAQEKLLRLNSATFSHVSTGTIINLVSNDVRRFEELALMWPYLWAAPIETVVATILIALVIGWVSAIAGVAALLMVIPIQGKLARMIAGLRQETAVKTDERVRITGELVEGAANVKMLCWEAPFEKLLGGIRKQEAKPMLFMQLIAGSTSAVMFFCVPVACVVAFGTAVGMGQVLVLDKVFYVVALLNLPKIWMAGLFLMAVKHASETLVAARRFFQFLQEVEPPAPAHKPPKDLAEGSIEFRGANFSWNSGAWAGQPDIQRGAATKQKSKSSKEDSNTKKTRKSKVGKSENVHDGVVSDMEKAIVAPITLREPRFKISPGDFVGVAGEVGSGKSSLLAAILGELQPIPQKGYYLPGQTPIEGAPVCKGRVAYCQQVPWIEAGSVRDNIIFGSKFEPEWYKQVKTACALDHDIAELPAADDTEIGERGINLSGGQKARLSLARAAYSRPDIALLDDPLSAVDPKVAKILFQQCIGPEGLLRNATRLLVTHQTQWLHACTRVLVIRGGAVIADSPWNVLKDSKDLPEVQHIESALHEASQNVSSPAGSETAKIDNLLFEGNAEIQHDSLTEYPRTPITRTPYDTASSTFSPEMPMHESAILENPLFENDASMELPSAVVGDTGPESTAEVSGKSLKPCNSTETSSRNPRIPGSFGNRTRDAKLDPDVVELSAMTQSSSNGTAGKSSKANSGRTTPDDSDTVSDHATKGQLTKAEHKETGTLKRGTLMKYFSAMGLWKVSFIMLAIIAGQVSWIISEWWLAKWSQASEESQRDDLFKWLGVYSALVAAIVTLSLARNLGWFVAGLHGSSNINANMLSSVLRAKLEFFHTTPTGRILNVLTKDQGAVDELLPLMMFQALQGFVVLLATLILVPIANPPITVAILPLAYWFGKVRQYYLASSREIKRFEAVTRSPVYAMFSATIKGLPTIRAFQVEGRFRNLFIEALDVNGSWKLAYQVTSRWVSAQMDFSTTALLGTTVLVATGAKSLMSAPLVALALTHVLQLSEAENNLTSVERMLAYTQLPQERAATVATGGAAAPPGWSKSATLEFDKVEARYRAGLPPVLKGLSFTVPSGTTCGVVGRTGSGKSSLLLAMYELIEITGGTVRLDGLDVSKVALNSLRQQIAVIPQDPLLFSDMWEALRSVQLEAPVTTLGGLDAHMAEAGGNFSAGQRQLLCLARALLTHVRVLALDEATANVDRATDAIIQSTLRTAVKGSDAHMERIMLVIAHRVDTVLDCDQLLVLSDGQLVQSGAPQELAESPGTFSELVAAARANDEAHMNAAS